jgi:hypothetical protein
MFTLGHACPQSSMSAPRPRPSTQLYHKSCACGLASGTRSAASPRHRHVCGPRIQTGTGSLRTVHPQLAPHRRSKPRTEANLGQMETLRDHGVLNCGSTGTRYALASRLVMLARPTTA